MLIDHLFGIKLQTLRMCILVLLQCITTLFFFITVTYELENTQIVTVPLGALFILANDYISQHDLTKVVVYLHP